MWNGLGSSLVLLNAFSTALILVSNSLPSVVVTIDRLTQT